MERCTVKLQGFEIDSFTADEALEYIYANRGSVVTINPEMIRYSKGDLEFASFVKNANLVIPDGIGVQIGLKIKGYDIKRIAGIEFAQKLICKFSDKSLPIAFIGAKPNIAELAVNNLKKNIPNLNAAYVQDGYFKDDSVILDNLKNSNAELVLLALGSPKQEFFMQEAMKLLPNAVFIGVGGSFDVWSGTVKRAPEIYQKLGLEWLYRTVKEPKRFKRIFPTLPLFMFSVIGEKIFGEK